jgi:protein arginine N-methyltransferase 1
MEKVDIIVSLCGNYTLFYENKLQNLIYARDHFLVKGGLMFPNIINFKVALIQD